VLSLDTSSLECVHLQFQCWYGFTRLGCYGGDPAEGRKGRAKATARTEPSGREDNRLGHKDSLPFSYIHTYIMDAAGDLNGVDHVCMRYVPSGGATEDAAGEEKRREGCRPKAPSFRPERNRRRRRRERVQKGSVSRPLSLPS